MGDLVAFVRAQLDELERTATAAVEVVGFDEWEAVGARDDDEIGRANWVVHGVAQPWTREPPMDGRRRAATGWPDNQVLTQFIALNDPATVLASVAADRAVLDERDGWQRVLDLSHNPTRQEQAVIALPIANRMVALLAQKFAGRPGWRDEWTAER